MKTIKTETKVLKEMGLHLTWNGYKHNKYNTQYPPISNRLIAALTLGKVTYSDKWVFNNYHIAVFSLIINK